MGSASSRGAASLLRRALSSIAPSLWCALFFAVSSASCGGSPPPPAAPDATSKPAEADVAKAKEPEPAPPKTLPTSCSPGPNGLCAPPADFVKSLCGGSFPDVALLMFGKDTPWTRAYLRRPVEAWNASGGASSNEKLQLDEEVLLLIHRAPDTGGMQVSGGAGGSYEALRWDGTCVSLMAEEVTTRLPPKAMTAKIPWKQLDTKTREAFSNHEKVGLVVADYRKECKGANFGEVSAKCVKVDAKLTTAIVDYIRGGGTIPTPPSIP